MTSKSNLASMDDLSVNEVIYLNVGVPFLGTHFNYRQGKFASRKSTLHDYWKVMLYGLEARVAELKNVVPTRGTLTIIEVGKGDHVYGSVKISNVLLQP